MPEIDIGGVPFQEAIDSLRQKVRLPTRAWTDLWEGMHARAFVVAGAMKAELVADFHQAVTAAIAEGRTLTDFREDFDRIVAAHGWSYRGSRGWRSAVIYDTNLRMAHASGRWAQIQRTKERRPFLRYVATLDSRTRPEHRAWHGLVLPADHAFWHTHYPPNGWKCRCTVQQLSRRDLDRRGLSVSEPPAVETVRHAINTPEGPAIVEAPRGIDPGFGYNVGEAGWGRGAEALAQERHGPFDPLEAPGGSRPAAPAPLRAAVPRRGLGPQATDEAGLRRALADAIGGDEAIFADPAGERVAVGQAIVDHLLRSGRADGREAFFPLIPELIEDPHEIWVGFAASRISGRVLMRRRYVKLFDLGRDRFAGLVADIDGGRWAGYTFFPGGRRPGRLRTGLRVYQKN